MERPRLLEPKNLLLQELRGFTAQKQWHLDKITDIDVKIDNVMGRLDEWDKRMGNSVAKPYEFSPQEAHKINLDARRSLK